MSNESLLERTKRITSDPNSLEDLCNHIANGGSIISWCELKDVRFSDIVNWFNADDARRISVTNAGEMQKEWAIHRLLLEIKSLAFVDIRQVFNDDHSLKPPSEWPKELASAIVGVEVDEIWDKELDDDNKMRKVKIGETKKIKMADKIKALELLGKDLGRFITKHEVTGKLTLEDLVTGSKKSDVT